MANRSLRIFTSSPGDTLLDMAVNPTISANNILKRNNDNWKTLVSKRFIFSDVGTN